MNKKLIYAFLLNFIGFSLFAGDLSTLERDVKNFPKEGYRPLSLGVDYYLNSQGIIKELDYKYAFCICGKGFFVVLNQNQEILFTRNGFFCVNDDGYLINKDGYLVLGIGSDIQNKEYKYISSESVSDKKDFKQKGLKRVDLNKKTVIDYFLIMDPENIIFFQDDYIIAQKYIPVKSYIKQYARESFSISFEQLLDICLEIFEIQKEDTNREKKKQIYVLLEYQKEIIFNENIFDTNDKKRLEEKLQEIKVKI